MRATVRIFAMMFLCMLCYFLMGVSSIRGQGMLAGEEYSVSLAGQEEYCIFDAYRDGALIATVKYKREESGKILNIMTN